MLAASTLRMTAGGGKESRESCLGSNCEFPPVLLKDCSPKSQVCALDVVLLFRLRAGRRGVGGSFKVSAKVPRR